MKNLKCALALVVTIVAASTSSDLFAQAPVMDGAVDGSYGAALSIQDTNTHFGNNTIADPIAGNGNELDQLFVTVANDGTKDRLYIMMAGNLNIDFTKLEIFIDSEDGVGQNTLVGDSLPASVDGYFATIGGGVNLPDPLDGAIQRMDGLTFDTGIAPDYYLTVSNGGERYSDPANGPQFWAVTAHYAELNNGASGRSVAAGMQIGPNGTNTPMRGPLAPDFDSDLDVDLADLMTWQRGYGVGTTKPEGDATGDGVVDDLDLSNPLGDPRDQTWLERFGQSPQPFDYPFVPSADFSTSFLQNQGSLPGLAPGELIDQTYALGTGGCSADTTDGGADCIYPELEFVLPADSDDPNNTRNHRDLLNEVDIQLAFDNSNIAGVSADTPFTTPTIEDPIAVTTGVEISIPLDEIGSPGTGDTINLVVFINGTVHDFGSNQFAFEIGSTGILEENFGGFPINLDTEAPGNQYVSITVPSLFTGNATVPEPTSVVLLSLAGALASLARRRR